MRPYILAETNWHHMKDKGERFFRAVTEKIGNVLFELWRIDPENMYEQVHPKKILHSSIKNTMFT